MTVVMMPGLKVPGDGSVPARTRQKFSVALSGKSARLFTELKELTDADTDSEVFRNALRLNYMLIKARDSGFEICMRETANGRIHEVLLSEDQPLGLPLKQAR